MYVFKVRSFFYSLSSMLLTSHVDPFYSIIEAFRQRCMPDNAQIDETLQYVKTTSPVNLAQLSPKGKKLVQDARNIIRTAQINTHRWFAPRTRCTHQGKQICTCRSIHHRGRTTTSPKTPILKARIPGTDHTVAQHPKDELGSGTGVR